MGKYFNPKATGSAIEQWLPLHVMNTIRQAKGFEKIESYFTEKGQTVPVVFLLDVIAPYLFNPKIGSEFNKSIKPVFLLRNIANKKEINGKIREFIR